MSLLFAVRWCHAAVCGEGPSARNSDLSESIKDTTVEAEGERGGTAETELYEARGLDGEAPALDERQSSATRRGVDDPITPGAHPLA